MYIIYIYVYYIYMSLSFVICIILVVCNQEHMVRGSKSAVVVSIFPSLMTGSVFPGGQTTG